MVFLYISIQHSPSFQAIREFVLFIVCKRNRVVTGTKPSFCLVLMASSSKNIWLSICLLENKQNQVAFAAILRPSPWHVKISGNRSDDEPCRGRPFVLINRRHRLTPLSWRDVWTFHMTAKYAKADCFLLVLVQYSLKVGDTITKYNKHLCWWLTALECG